MKPEIKTLLEYQKTDAEFNKLEKEILSNASKINAQNALNKFKEAQKQAEDLEEKAGRAIEEFNKVKSLYETNASLAGKLSKIDVEKLTDEKIVNLNNDLEGVLNNLAVIEKKLLSLNKNVESILSNFETAKKEAAKSKTLYVENKNKYDEFLKNKSEELATLKTNLATLQKAVNPGLFAKYQKIRQDKIFPVIVPLNSTLCGYCQMSINANDANSLKENGYIICENCHRIIYI